jgi:hypothetical protein
MAAVLQKVPDRHFDVISNHFETSSFRCQGSQAGRAIGDLGAYRAGRSRDSTVRI